MVRGSRSVFTEREDLPSSPGVAVVSRNDLNGPVDLVESRARNTPVLYPRRIYKDLFSLLVVSLGYIVIVVIVIIIVNYYLLFLRLSLLILILIL